LPPAVRRGAERPTPSRWRSALAITLVVSALCLFDGNLDGNEAGKLALARQAVDPGWIPTDWYLNDSQGYQWLFQQLSGRTVAWLGFGPGSLLVRLLGYGLWGWALAGITGPLGLPPALAALAAGLFSLQQGVLAAEWMVGSAEPKTFAYAALLLAYSAWRQRRWWPCGLASGLACSCHLLVGGFGVLALAGLTLLRGGGRWSWRRLGPWLSGCGLAGLPAGLAVAEQLLGRATAPLEPAGAALPPTSWIYVVLRNPHHLLPGSWSAGDWARLALMLGLFSLAAATAGVRRPGHDPQRQASRDLALWVVMSWPLALLGLVAGLGVPASAAEAPAGNSPALLLLSLYPFRVADTLLMLGLWLLLAAALARWLAQGPLGAAGRRQLQRGLVGLALLLSLVGVLRELPQAAARGRRGFVDTPERAELYAWIRSHSPPTALVVAPPTGFEDLALHTGRPGLVQFKQVPTASTALHIWFTRLTALAGGEAGVWRGPGGWEASGRLVRAYGALSPAALAALAERHGATLLITATPQPGPPGWRPARRNRAWTLWQRP
jgi:hypothetical protein